MFHVKDLIPDHRQAAGHYLYFKSQSLLFQIKLKTNKKQNKLAVDNGRENCLTVICQLQSHITNIWLWLKCVEQIFKT